MPQFSIITTFFVLLLSASALDFCQYIIDDDTIYGFYGVPALNISSHFFNDTYNGTVMFDLCGSAITPCQTYAAGETNYIAVAFNGTNTSECQNLAAGAVATASFIDSSDASDGVILTFPSVSNANSSITTTLVVTVTCNSSISASDMNWTSVLTVFANGSSIYNLTTSGDPGCPEISLENFMEFFTAYEGYFAICLFVIGGFTLFFGLKFHKITIFIYSTILIFLVTFVLLEIVTGAKAGGVLQWVLFAFCIIGGLGFGYVAIRWPKIGFFAMGAVGGGVAAFFIYSLILHFVSGLTKWAMYGFIAGLAVITGLLAIWLWEFLIIIVMSFVGAYMTVRSISFFIGGFPNELSVIEGFEQYDNTDYVYLGVMIAIAIMGMVFQFTRRRDALKAKKAKAERKKKIEMTDNSKIDAGNESKTDIESELL